MTNSDQNGSKPSDSQEAQFLQEISIPELISKEVNDLFAVKAKKQDDFLFNENPENYDLDGLADTLFEQMYQHTNEGQEGSQENHQISEETS